MRAGNRVALGGAVSISVPFDEVLGSARGPRHSPWLETQAGGREGAALQARATGALTLEPGLDGLWLEPDADVGGRPAEHGGLQEGAEPAEPSTSRAARRPRAQAPLDETGDAPSPATVERPAGKRASGSTPRSERSASPGARPAGSPGQRRAATRQAPRVKLPPRFVAELLMRCTVRERAAQARARELAASANLSAWLPQLRVRVGRYRDETLRLIPTEAEPDRWQLTDGADLRVDATAVWRLDRVVFASEEVALERALEQRAERVERRRREVLALLFKWHRAAWLLAAWSSGPDSDARVAGDPRLDERVELWLALVQVTAELDEWSGGWFSRHAPAFGAAE